MKTAIVLAFDRFAARWLGCYGNTECPTPNIDRFAASSIVFDQHFSADRDRPLSDVILSAWQATNIDFQAVVEQRAEFGPPSSLFETRWELRPHDDSDNEFRGSPGVLEAAARTVASWIGSSKADRFLWIQAAGIDGEEDVTDDAESSPNRLQTTRLDSAFGKFWAAVESMQESSPGEWLVVFTSQNGVADPATQFLPESIQPPAEFEPLSEAAMHTPLIIHATGCEMGTRRRSLVQNRDLWPTLNDWFGIASSPDENAGRSLLPIVRDAKNAEERDYICLTNDKSAVAIRTPDWLLQTTREFTAQREQPLDSEQVRMFVKPDDSWEIHNVTGQEPEQAESLLKILHDHLLG